MREFIFLYIRKRTENKYFITINPQVCSLRKVKMYTNIGVAQKKATQT